MARRPLDRIDGGIIKVLIENSKTSVSDIGATVGLTRNAADQRIKRMERDGVIRGYTIKYDPSVVIDRVRALLFVYLETSMDRKTAARIDDILEIKFCALSSGDIDIVAIADSHSIPAIEKVRKTIAALPGVKRVALRILTEEWIDRL